jgi:hypothetical protein
MPTATRQSFELFVLKEVDMRWILLADAIAVTQLAIFAPTPRKYLGRHC